MPEETRLPIALRFLQTVRQFRKLDNIERYAMMRCNKKQSVSEHTMSVVLIVFLLSYELLQLQDQKWRLKALTKAIFHDFEETFTGDIPYDVKFRQEQLKSVLEIVGLRRLNTFLSHVRLPAMWHAFALDATAPPIIESLIVDMVKFADILELYLFTEEEVLSGNLHMIPVLQRAKDMIQNCKLIGVSEIAKEIAEEIGKAETPGSYEMIESYPGPLLLGVAWEKIEDVFRSIFHLRREENGN